MGEALAFWGVVLLGAAITIVVIGKLGIQRRSDRDRRKGRPFGDEDNWPD